jgi:hypothetical protein
VRFIEKVIGVGFVDIIVHATGFLAVVVVVVVTHKERESTPTTTTTTTTDSQPNY